MIQTCNAFKAHLPDSSPVNLCTERAETGSRVFVSTYQTMMNLIDEMNGENRRFGVGYFDLIITDSVWFYRMEADGFSLDDKRSELLPLEKLGPNVVLKPEEHTKNNLPDIARRWRTLGERTGTHPRQGEFARKRS